MVNIEKLLSAADQDFINSGIAHSPYCVLNELLILTNLSQVAKGREDLNTGGSLVTTGSIPIPRGIAKTINIPHSYFGYGTYSALVTQSTAPETEGMLVGYNIGGVRHAGRHFFSGMNVQTHYPYERHPGEVLINNLLELHIKTRHDEQDAITTLMALLAVNNINVGSNFESNIRTFGEWYHSNHPKGAKFYWRE